MAEFEVKTDRIGQTSIANNGQEMTLIGYRNCQDIDVRFEDGTIVRHRTYNSFTRGRIKNPSSKIKTGLKRKANNGQMMEIIAWRSKVDIDVRFEDGTVVYNKAYTNFLKGSIRNPNRGTKK